MRDVLVISVFFAFVLLFTHAQNDAAGEDSLDVENYATFPSIVTVKGNVPEAPSCGGTLLDDHVVLTAAQCVLGAGNTTRLPNVVLDSLNAQRTNRMPQTRITMETIVYPGYTGVIRDGNDFALLRLDHSVAPLKSVKFFEGDTPFETNLVIIGAAGEAIRIRSATVADPAECENAGMLLDKESMICMTGEIPCDGDEGGPILDAATGKLMAVVSSTIDCRKGGNSNTHVAVMTVQNPKVLNWIRQTSSDLEYTASLNLAPSVIAFDGPPSNQGVLSVPAPEADEDLSEDEADEEMVYDVLGFL